MSRPVKKKSTDDAAVRAARAWAMASDDTLNIRLPAAEKRIFELEAYEQKLDLTTWVRLHLRKAARLD
jgi:hypothetical protein